MVDKADMACYNQYAHFYARIEIVADYLLDIVLKSCNAV